MQLLGCHHPNFVRKVDRSTCVTQHLDCQIQVLGYHRARGILVFGEVTRLGLASDWIIEMWSDDGAH